MFATVRRVAAAVVRGLDADGSFVANNNIVSQSVPHLHVHVHPAWGLEAFDFSQAATDPDPAEMDDAARRLREGLAAAGHGASVPAS